MWSDTDLTEIPVNSVPALVESALDAYTDGSGEHVNFIGTDQHVHELYNGQFSSNQWTDNDLTHAANDAVLPAPGSALAGYMTNYGEHVIFIDADGHVHELYNGQFSSNQWVDTDLTVKAVNGVPALAGSALDAYTDGSGEHVNFIGFDGHVHELYNGEFSSGQWTDNDLTKAANDAVVPAPGSALAGYTDGSGEHVIFIAGDGHVHELYNGEFSSGKWTDNDLTHAANGIPAFVGSTSTLDAYTDGSGEHVNFIAGDGHVHELYNGEFSSGKWTDNDLSHAANAANPVSAFFGSPLAGYTDGSGEHVNFIATDGDVHQLYNGEFSSNQWTDNDLIGTGGFGAPGSNGSSLAAYSDGSGQHVYYTVRNPIVGNANVYELLS
jgi:hypothetical protein